MSGGGLVRQGNYGSGEQISGERESRWRHKVRRLACSGQVAVAERRTWGEGGCSNSLSRNETGPKPSPPGRPRLDS
jgi:hypothetical protein